MKVNFAHCFFEQSGTFKNAFYNLGVPAADYDYENKFGETNNVLNLFYEIHYAYYEQKSIFDNIDPGDLIIAFFPCIYFESQSYLVSRCDSPQFNNYSYIDKLKYNLAWTDDFHVYYSKFNMLFSVCLKRGLRLIVENPYSKPNYLSEKFPIKPTIIDSDRRDMGDYFKKPTQYWFINCIPEDNFIFEPLEYVENLSIPKIHGFNRSRISSQYADRFIRRFILGG